MAVVIDGEFKRVEEVVRVSLGEEVIISEAARSRIGKSREAVEDIVREERVSTEYRIRQIRGRRHFLDDLRTLQENLVVSHAVGTGDVQRTEVRAAAYLRANALAKGNSVRLSVVEALAGYEQSVSCRAPERFCGCQRRPRACPYSPVAAGKGMARYRGLLPAAEALASRHEPLQLEAKEGLL